MNFLVELGGALGFFVVLTVGLVLAINFILAIAILATTEHHRVGMHKVGWVVLTLIVGPLAAIPYALIQRGGQVVSRCPFCGFTAQQAELDALCPQCQTALERMKL